MAMSNSRISCGRDPTVLFMSNNLHMWNAFGIITLCLIQYFDAIIWRTIINKNVF